MCLKDEKKKAKINDPVTYTTKVPGNVSQDCHLL
jgi:hypothetical protein